MAKTLPPDSPSSSVTPSQPTQPSHPTHQPHSSLQSHPSLVPSLNPRPYRSCSSPRLRVITETPGPGRTLQAFKDECDINKIMSRYNQTGVIDHINRAQPRFGDLQAPDFQDAMNLVIDAEQRFAALPSDVRDRFGNDPARLLSFVADQANAAEAARLGLIDAPAAPVPPMLGTPPAAPAAAVAPPGGIPTPASPTPTPPTPAKPA